MVVDIEKYLKSYENTLLMSGKVKTFFVLKCLTPNFKNDNVAEVVLKNWRRVNEN